jgi:hypothetical protein
MNLQELMETYIESEKFKEKFPKMWDYSKEIEVIEWKKEFGIVDSNPEVIENIEFLDILLKNGMITEKEYTEKLKNLKGYSSKTLGIAFIEKKQVSFRSKRPTFYVIVHELGHCYFETPDILWSSAYGGGESILWLIYQNKIEGDEETIKKWMEIIKLSHKERDKVIEMLNDFAKKITEKYQIQIPNNEKPIIGLMNFAGVLAQEELLPFSFLIDLIEGAKWSDPLFHRFAIEFLNYIKTEKLPLTTS